MIITENQKSNFLANLVRVESGCLEFVGAKNSAGYGHVFTGSKLDRTNKIEGTHRVAFTIANGPIPAGMLVCHKCDNPPCCDPEHLFVGTHKDNVQDMLSKGRGGYTGSPCESNGRAKITPRNVRRILAGNERPVDLQNEFGIGKTQYYRIKRGEAWATLGRVV